MSAGSQASWLGSTCCPAALVSQRELFSTSTTGSSARAGAPASRIAARMLAARCSTNSSATRGQGFVMLWQESGLEQG